MRYEYETPWEKRNDLAYWSQSLNKIVVVQGNAVPAFQNLPLVSGQSLGVTNTNYIDLGKKNFAPRFGFAYRPFNTSHFVIRGSYGIFYNPMSEYDDVIDARDLGLNPPFRATYSYTTRRGRCANPHLGQSVSRHREPRAAPPTHRFTGSRPISTPVTNRTGTSRQSGRLTKTPCCAPVIWAAKEPTCRSTIDVNEPLPSSVADSVPAPVSAVGRCRSLPIDP